MSSYPSPAILYNVLPSLSNILNTSTSYVPDTLNICFRSKKTLLLWDRVATVSAWNTDQTDHLTVTEVNYYDKDGRLFKKYLEKPLQISPNGSTRF
ncbi:MAG: DUF3124 domain-containing protein [Syntrophobacterales bacterium]|nr:DUF3124 domain-containing protein [Syntrophobacterales bacterium]